MKSRKLAESDVVKLTLEEVEFYSSSIPKPAFKSVTTDIEIGQKYMQGELTRAEYDMWAASEEKKRRDALSCSFCARIMSSDYTLRRQILHVNKELEKFECEYCEKVEGLITRSLQVMFPFWTKIRKVTVMKQKKVLLINKKLMKKILSFLCRGTTKLRRSVRMILHVTSALKYLVQNILSEDISDKCMKIKGDSNVPSVRSLLVPRVDWITIEW